MHLQTATILAAMSYDPERDFSVGQLQDGSVVITRWLHSDPVPTSEEITAIANGSKALPSGLTYPAWLEENGGDTRKTRRKKLRMVFRDAVDNDDVLAVGLRALIDIAADKLTVPRATMRAEVLQRMFQIVEQES